MTDTPKNSTPTHTAPTKEAKAVAEAAAAASKAVDDVTLEGFPGKMPPPFVPDTPESNSIKRY